MASEVTAAFGLALAKTRRGVLRAGKPLSQERLAEAARLDRTYVSLMERGLRQSTLSTIFRLATALDVPAVDLIRDTERRLRRMSR